MFKCSIKVRSINNIPILLKMLSQAIDRFVLRSNARLITRAFSSTPSNNIPFLKNVTTYHSQFPDARAINTASVDRTSQTTDMTKMQKLTSLKNNAFEQATHFCSVAGLAAARTAAVASAYYFGVIVTGNLTAFGYGICGTVQNYRLPKTVTSDDNVSVPNAKRYVLPFDVSKDSTELKDVVIRRLGNAVSYAAVSTVVLFPALFADALEMYTKFQIHKKGYKTYELTPSHFFPFMSKTMEFCIAAFNVSRSTETLVKTTPVSLFRDTINNINANAKR